MSDITLEQLRLGIPMICTIALEEDGVHGEIQIFVKDGAEEADPVVAVPIDMGQLDSNQERVTDDIASGLSAWLDLEGFEKYSFVLGRVYRDGSFILKLDPDDDPSE